MTGDALMFHPQPSLTERKCWLHRLSVAVMLAASLLLTSHLLVFAIFLEGVRRVLGHRKTSEQRIKTLQASHGCRSSQSGSFSEKQPWNDLELDLHCVTEQAWTSSGQRFFSKLDQLWQLFQSQRWSSRRQALSLLQLTDLQVTLDNLECSAV